jgi:hypothetical protein
MRHVRTVCLYLLPLGFVGISACGDDSPTAPVDAAIPGEWAIDASTADGAASLSPIDASAIDGGAVPVRGIVVIHSDYQSSSVSLLDRDGNLVKDGCLHSGSGTPGLSMTLSEDLALPSQSPPGSPVVVIDRGNATLTWLDPATCAPLGQMPVGTGFAANPHDYVALSGSKAYVPRYKPNAVATPTPGDFDDGNDVLIVDPARQQITGRIDLLPFTPASVLPRADRALLVDGKVYLSLNAVDEKFKVYAMARVLTIDPTIDQVVGLVDVPGMQNCGAMTYLPSEKKLLLACTGDYVSVAGSGIVALDLGVLPLAVAAVLPAASAGGRAFSNAAVAALDGNTIFGVALGDFSDTPPDTLWLLALGGSPGTTVFDSAESFTLGSLLADVERGRVFVTDGTMQTPAWVRVFERAGGVFHETNPIKTNPTQKLPPRALAWF